VTDRGGSRELAAILFDLDGTLADTAKLWDRAVRALIRTRQAAPSAVLLGAIHGLDARTAVERLHVHHAWHSYDVADDVAWLEDHVLRACAERPPWRPTGLRLVGSVRRAGVATALVTSSRRSLVERMMGRYQGLFDVVVCGDDVSRPKPHPEPYRVAMAHLGAAPHRCVAIEDSEPGAASARAAGCSTLRLGLDTVDGRRLELRDVSLDLLESCVRVAGRLRSVGAEGEG
jgi:HAD superfamily hydrolase (TIGR01509 family)